jgi:hypothetical protein
VEERRKFMEKFLVQGLGPIRDGLLLSSSDGNKSIEC